MTASFLAAFQNAGVDQKRRPAGMIIRRGHGQSNFFSFANGTGFTFDPPSGLEITQEFKPNRSLPPLMSMPAAIMEAFRGRKPTLNFLTWPTFKVTVTAKSAAPRKGWKITARNSHTKSVVTLEVAVLGERRIKLAVRPVQIPARRPDGGPAPGTRVLHSKKGFDINAMVATMNEIWTPQANVVFTLVSSEPVLIEDSAEIARILDLRSTDTAPLPAIVDLQKFKDLLAREKDKSADLTIFLVEQAADTNPKVRIPHIVAGASDSDHLGIALVGDDRINQPEVMAHEAGHFMGYPGTHPVSDPDALMRDGGAPAAWIPYDDVLKYFNPP